MSTKSTYVNLAYLEEMVGGSNELIIELVTIFNTQVPEFLEEMKTHYKNKDWKALGLIAHKAKSSVAIMGMTELAAALKELELNAKEAKNIETYLDCITKFETLGNLATQELNEIVKNF